MVLHRALDAQHSVETPYPDSSWIVMKFGGRGVATAENWARIALDACPSRSKSMSSQRPCWAHYEAPPPHPEAAFRGWL
jgi:hypothetical protein